MIKQIVKRAKKENDNKTLEYIFQAGIHGIDMSHLAPVTEETPEEVKFSQEQDQEMDAHLQKRIAERDPNFKQRTEADGHE